VVSVTIVPIDGTVEAAGCTSESFTIVAETPSCTNLASPLNGATDIAIDLNQITWNASTNATAYKVTITGTTNNNVTNFETSDTFYNFTNSFVNDEVVTVTIVPINGTANNNITNFETTDTFYEFTSPFLNNEAVIVTIIPVNGTVEASGCASEVFNIVKIPLCTSLISPFNGETDVIVETDLEWDSIFNAEGYILSIGTMPGGTDVLDNEDVGLTTSYSFNDDLESITTYYVTITPYNINGEAENCIESNFTTLVIPKNDVKYGFSPNGDGVNDFWNIIGIEDHPNNTVSIFNRWGDLVFQIDDYNNTSNVFRGIANKKTKMGAGKLPDGTYFFQFSISGEHNFKTLKGYVVIKR